MSTPPVPPDTPLFHKLWAAQNGACALCQKPMPARRAEVAHATLWKRWRPTFDHIIPKGAGGGDAPRNLRLAHAICNKRRGRRMDKGPPRLERPL
ncbi:MAG: HNH endonuclease [Pseudomonadota bacterium]